MIKTNSSTHEDIARRAREIWDIRGSPSGLDTEIWLEAEQQLDEDSLARQNRGTAESTPASALADRGTAALRDGAAWTETVARGPSAGDLPGNGTPPPSPDAIAAKKAFQKNAARSPQQRHGKRAPKLAPSGTGKPLWDKPHSS